MGSSIIQTQSAASRGEVVIDSNGRLYAAYKKTLSGTDYLAMSYSDDVGLTWTEVTTAAPTGLAYITIAIDSQDNVHVAYIRGTYITSYRTFSALAWGTQEDIFDGTSNTDRVDSIAIAIDGSDFPHVAISQDNASQDDYELFYTNRTTGSWAARTQLSNDTIFAGAEMNPQRVSIRINSLGDIWVFFYSLIGIGSAWGWCRNTGSGWSAPTIQHFVFDNGYEPVSVIDSNNNIHVIMDFAGGTHTQVHWLFTYATSIWSSTTIQSASSFDMMGIGRLSDDTLFLIYGASASVIPPYYRTYNGSWGAQTATDTASANMGASDLHSIGRIATTVWPKLGGVSTQVPTAGYFFVYVDAQFGNSMRRFGFSSDINFSTPQDKNYSREAVGSLPAADSNLSNLFITSEYTAVATEDSVTADQAATNQYAMILFKNKGNTSSDDINVSWIGKSSIAPSASTAVLQIYNRNSGLWETLDSNSTAAANTPFTLSGSKVSGLSNYYDGSNWVSCRVYQLAQ